MSQNRKRRAESDGNEESPSSETMESEILKKIRSEMKKNQEKNEKKIEDLKIAILEQKLESLKENQKIRQKLEEIEMEMKKEMANLKSELLAETQQKLEEIEKKNEEKLSELKNEMLQEMKKIQKVPETKEIPVIRLPKIEPPSETDPEISIREAILGEWKMIEHENFERFKNIRPNLTLERFRNRKFEIVDGKLQQSGGGFAVLEEKENSLILEDNHLKSFWNKERTIDRYIENGKLHIVWNYKGEVWKFVYEKI